MSADESDNGRCRSCGGELIPFEHRPNDGTKSKDPSLCKINSIPIADHICVAECFVTARICKACRLVIGPDTKGRRAPVGWTKRNGIPVRVEDL